MTCYPAADWSCYPDVQSLDDDLKNTAELLGWSAFNAMIGYQVPGTCPTSLRPCSRGCARRTWYANVVGGGSFAGADNGSFAPFVGLDGQWVNACGCSTDDCSCTVVHQILLPGPAGSVVKVSIDGAVLDPSAYRVDNGIWLVRQDGEAWPICQDMNAAAGAVGSFVVDYIRGYPLNPLFATAAGMLAAEFVKACSGKDCALPANVTSLTRQGVTQQFDTNPFDGGTSGLPMVDAIVSIFNPYHLKTPPQVISPDTPSQRMRTA